MSQFDCRLDFVAVLAAGTAPTSPQYLALIQQLIGGQRGGMWLRIQFLLGKSVGFAN
jgi:hypothetical protein